MTIEAQAQESDASVRSNQLWMLALLAAAVVATSLVSFSTAPAGPGISPDGVVYVDVARHMAAGDGPVAFNAGGETELVTTWPPLFPTLVSIGVVVGADAVESARWINAFAFGLLCFLTGLLVWRISGRREGALLAGWLLALSPRMLAISGGVFTEPIFLALVTGMLLLLLRGGRWSLAGAGLLAGLACMQRYAGYAFVAGASLWLLQTRGEGWRARVTSGALFAAAATPLPLGWRVAAWLGSSTLDERSAGFSFPSATHFKAVAHSISTWLLPETWAASVRAMFAVAIVLLMLAGVIYAIRQRLRPGSARDIDAGALLLVLCGIAYAGLLAATITFLDPKLQPDPRLMLPFLPLGIIGLALALNQLKGSAFKFGVAAGAVLLIASALRAGDVSSGLRDGAGYTSPRWRNSATLYAALEQSPDLPVWSNNPQPLILYGKRVARSLPINSGMDYTKPEGTPPYKDNTVALEAMYLDGLGGGVIVWFDNSGSPEELGLLIRTLDLVPKARYEDGLLLEERTPRK